MTLNPFGASRLPAAPPALPASRANTLLLAEYHHYLHLLPASSPA